MPISILYKIHQDCLRQNLALLFLEIVLYLKKKMCGCVGVLGMEHESVPSDILGGGHF